MTGGCDGDSEYCGGDSECAGSYLGETERDGLAARLRRNGERSRAATAREY